jgi:type IV pilus assembly protein PilM
MGGNVYTEAVQKELNLSFESAERVKRGESVDGVHADEVRPILAAVTENLLLEIQKTFDFFRATAASERIDRVLLSGGTARVAGLADALAERIGAPVEPFDPFRTIQIDARKFGIEHVAEVAPTAAVAVGLALRRAGDR